LKQYVQSEEEPKELIDPKTVIREIRASTPDSAQTSVNCGTLARIPLFS
jgi:hypothetical protein